MWQVMKCLCFCIFSCGAKEIFRTAGKLKVAVFHAGVLILLYNFIIPGLLFNGLRAAKVSGRIDGIEFRQGHGWFLEKYRAVRATALWP